MVSFQVHVHLCLSGLVSTVKHLFYLGGNQNGHCLVMSSPSMVAAVARETLIDKVVADIRTLLRHGFIPPEDGGNVDEALFNCLLACQSSSPWGISLTDLFDGQNVCCSAPESDRGIGDEEEEDVGGNDRRLLCHLLKLSLRRRQLSHLLRNFCSSADVLNLWYSEGAFIRRVPLSGSLLLLVRAIETDRPGLLSCMLTRPPFVEKMFSVRSDRPGAVEQAVEVTAEMDLEDSYDDYPPELFLDGGDDGLSYLSSSIKETMQSLLSFFTNQRSSTNSQSSNPEGDNTFLSLSPSSTQSVPILGSSVTKLQKSRKDFHSVGEDPFSGDAGQVAYQKLSASDLHITRLCVQAELQPNHLYSASTKESSCLMDADIQFASVSPPSSSPVGQTFVEVVTDLIQPGVRQCERQRRSSIQLYLSDNDGNYSPRQRKLASSGDESSIVDDDSTIRLPAIAALRRTAGDDSDTEVSSLSAERRGSSDAGLSVLSSVASIRAKKLSDASAHPPPPEVRGHRRVFSDGLPPEVLSRLHSGSTNSLPLQAALDPVPPPPSPPLVDDHESMLTDGSGATSDSCETTISAIGPELDDDNDTPSCNVPYRVTRTLFSPLNFNLELEVSRLNMLVDDLYSQGLNELLAASCTQRLRQRLNMKISPNGHADNIRWFHPKHVRDALVADLVTSNAGEGFREDERTPMLLKDPLCEDELSYEETDHEILAEFDSMLPSDDVIRHSSSLMKLLVICLHSPDLHRPDSPFYSSAFRLSSLSPSVKRMLDEASTAANVRLQSNNRSRRLDFVVSFSSIRRLGKGAFSTTDAFAPPEVKVLLEIYSKKHRMEQLALQSYRCSGCGQPSTPQLAKRFRFCDYFGCYFCELCHHGDSAMIIPGRVLRQWNFSVFPVSVPAVEFLKRLFHRPLFRPPRSLFLKVRVLREFDDLRRQLALFIPFLNTCRMACSIRDGLFQNLPRHWLWPEASKAPLYSMQDLSKLRWGKVMDHLRLLLRRCVEHVSVCPLCQAKGFICELCSRGAPIFPFELVSTFQCLVCGACYHRTCWKTCPEGASNACCPRCSRIEERRRQQAKEQAEESESDSKEKDELGSSSSVVNCSVPT